MPSISFKRAKIHYSIYGKGETIVFLHGFLEDRNIWNLLVNDLESRFRCITIDLPGHGASHSLGEVHNMEDMAATVKAVIDHLLIDKIILAGHSMGGYVALAFAEKYPENISALSLINSTPKADSDEKRLIRDKAVEAVKNDKRNFIRLSIPQLFAAENLDEYKKDVQRLIANATQLQTEGITAAIKGMKIRRDRSHILKNADFPCQIIIGLQDQLISIDSLKDLEIQSQVEIVKIGGGHMSYIENKSELSYFFKHFIENL